MKLQTQVVLVLFCLQKTFETLISSSISGKNPRAVNVSNTDVVLLYNSGVATFTKNSVTSRPGLTQLHTDQYSNLFRLDSNWLVLVKGQNMNIVLFKNDLTGIVSSFPTTNPTTEMYQYSVISDTEFVITYVKWAYYCKVNSLNVVVNELPFTTANNNQRLTCDYSKMYNTLLCAYTDSSSVLSFIIFNMTSNTSHPITTYSLSDADSPLIRANHDFNSFSLCYNLLNNWTINCETLKLKKEIIGFSLIHSVAKYYNSIQTRANGKYDIKFIGNNLFVIYKNNNSVSSLDHLSPSNLIISSPVIGTDRGNFDSPIIYSIGLSVGYVYDKDNTIQILLFDYKDCKSDVKYSRQSTEGWFVLDRKQSSSSVFTYFEFPQKSSVLYQGQDLIASNTTYADNNFTYMNFYSTGKATWLFTETDTPTGYHSLLCQVTLIICYSSCKECNQNIFGSSTAHQCTDCILPYYPYVDSSKNGQCDSLPNPSYYLNGASEFESCNASCSTCEVQKNQCTKCAVDYFPLEDDSTKCITGNYPGYFRNSTDIVYKKCYQSCQSCFSIGVSQNHNCDLCNADYSKGITTIQNQCYRFCDKPIAITENTNICIAQQNQNCSNNINNVKLTVDGTTECVSDCKIFLPNKPLFKLNNICYATCSSPYVRDYENYTCVNATIGPGPNPPIDPPGPLDPPEGSRIKAYQDNNSTGNCQDPINVSIQNYIHLKNNISANNSNAPVDLIYYCISTFHSIALYNISDTDIKPKVYKKYNVSEINFTLILDTLDNPNSIFVMQIDKYRPDEFTNQTEYYLFYANLTPVILPSSYQHNVSITSPIRDTFTSNITLIQSMAKKNIDILNQSSLFYNDICFKYTDEDNHRDVILLERREKYFPKKELCETNCNYTSFDYSKITCNCTYNATSEFTTDIKSNPATSPFKDKDLQTYTVVTCALEVFKLDDILRNVSFWIFLSFCITIVVLAFCFICTGMTYANKYIIDVLKASKQLNTNQSENINLIIPIANNNPNPNPPPKSKDGKKPTQVPEEDSSHTQIEEEEFGDVKINNYQKKEKARLRQNFMKELDDMIQDEKTKGENDEKAIILKLRSELMGKNDNNPDLQKYFFTKNSDNESNPNYSKQMDRSENDTGRSYSQNQINSSFIKEMLIYGEGEDDLIEDNEDPNGDKKQNDKHNSDLSSNKIIVKKREQSISEENQKSKADMLQDNFFGQYKPIEIGNKTEMSSSRKLSLLNKDKELARNLQNNQNQLSERDKINSVSPLVNNQSAINKDDDNDVNVKTPKSFCRAYFNYMKRREIFMITFCANKTYLPFFITFPIFLFCLTIMFTIHALLFTNSFIQERYIKEESIDFAFWIENELFKSFYVALIGNLVKIIIIKILIFFVFRIEKKMLSRQNYPIILQRLRCRSATIFVILIIMMGALFYINTCYCGIFVNTQAGLFIGYAVSVVISFFVAMLLCFIINIIRLIGISCNCA